MLIYTNSSAQRFEEVHDRLERIESTLLRLVTALEAANSRSPPPPPPSPAAAPAAAAACSPAGGCLPESMFRPPTLLGPSECSSPSIHFSVGPQVGKEYALRGAKLPRKRRDVQYLGPSSMLSLSIEAGSLAEETLRQKSASPGSRAGSTGSRSESRYAGARMEALGESLGPSEQVETIGALKKLSSLSSNVASWFPYYGHKELRLGAGGANMKIPDREEAEALAKGIIHNLLYICTCSNWPEYFRNVHVWLPIFDETRFMECVADFYTGDAKLAKDRAWLVCFNNVLLFGLFNRNTSRVLAESSAGKDFFLNGWAAIDDIGIFLGPRLRNIQALMTGAVIANEISRPGLCWSLVAQAARLAQAIGLHRSSNDANLTKSEIQERRCIFWNIYILDKCLSLSFGRSTCLPDFDCDVELPEDPGNPYFKNFLALICLAKIQSHIYVRLYSASAVRLADEARAKIITELDAELRKWWEDKKPIFFNADGTVADSPRSADGTEEKPLDIFSRMELQFSYLCSLTLVHRTARPGMLGWAASESICLESSRESIRIINRVVENNLIIANSGMIMWLVFLFLSFLFYSALAKQQN